MAHPVAHIFHQAAALNLNDRRRRGNLIHVESECELIATGDIHGNRFMLGKILKFAELPSFPNRRLVLQEIIHGPPDRDTGQDRSVELLLRAARLKVSHPEQVLFVLGNHDIAQITGKEITKNGMGVCEAFSSNVRSQFEDDADEVMAAVKEFLLSMALAVRSPGGTMLAHSLPTPGRMDTAGIDILHRPYRLEDLQRGGAVYEWTWGRGQSNEQLEELCKRLEVEFFVLGHRHLEVGYEIIGHRAVSLASNHPQGCVLIFSSDETLTAELIPDRAKRITALCAGRH